MAISGHDAAIFGVSARQTAVIHSSVVSAPTVPVMRPEPIPAARALRWIEGPSIDLPFYIGGALLGWAVLLAHVVGHVSTRTLYWIWILFLDGPHLWATLSRTYFDREERRTRGPALVGAFAWALLPLATLGWGFATGGRLPFFLFLTFAQLWAYWHVVRQHYGFLSLYQRKGAEPTGTQNPVDYVAFYTVMLAPFVSFALRHPMARHELGLPATPGAVEQALCRVALAATAGAIVAYVAKEWRLGPRVNVAKNLFLLACVPLHVVALLHPTWSTSMDLLALPIIVTSFHNVQYDAIVWCYGRRRYGEASSAERYGSAARLFQNAAAWLLAGVALTVVFRYATWSLDGRYWPFAPSTAARTGPFSSTEYVNAFWWAIAMHHYYLDQKIWRPGRDGAVRAGLGLEAAAR